MFKVRNILLLAGVLPIMFTSSISAKGTTLSESLGENISLYQQGYNLLQDEEFCSLDENKAYSYLLGEVENIKPVEVKKVEPPVEEKPILLAKAETKSVTKKVRPSRGGDIPTSKAINMSEEERYWLEKLVEAEAADEPYEGKLAVCNVIANRLANGGWGSSINSVIRAKGQFSPFADGSIHRRTPSEETKKAVAQVFDYGHRVLPNDAMYFMMKNIKNNEIPKSKKLIKIIENHAFYSKYNK